MFRFVSDIGNMIGWDRGYGNGVEGEYGVFYWGESVRNSNRRGRILVKI